MDAVKWRLDDEDLPDTGTSIEVEIKEEHRDKTLKVEAYVGDEPSDRGFYGDRAEWYDRIYHWKDYPTEAAGLVEVLAEEGIGERARVLEVACGTGSFLAPLSTHYEIAGLDRSSELLAIAAGKVPGAPLTCGDMRAFEVDRPFDALLCLFSSIGYLRDESELAATVACFAAALRPGGVLLIEPWLDPSDFRPGHAALDVWRGDDLHLARSAFAIVITT